MRAARSLPTANACIPPPPHYHAFFSFLCRIPVEGFFGIFFSFWARLILKVIVDFTGNVGLRHPHEVGGAMWLYSLCLSLVGLPLAILYYDSKKEEEDDIIVEKAWKVCFTLLPFLCVVFSIFIIIIKKEYRKTFVSVKTGKDLTMSYFDREKDREKALLFLRNKRHWKEIEMEVANWVREKWKTWMKEKPDWLDDNMKSRIPPHMIPVNRDRISLMGLRKSMTLTLGMTHLSAANGPHNSRTSVFGVKRVTPDENMR